MFNIFGNAKGFTGYSVHVRNLLLGLYKLKVPVHFSQLPTPEPSVYPDETTQQAILSATSNKRNDQGYNIYIDSPCRIPNPGEKDIIYFPWEPSVLPKIKNFDLQYFRDGRTPPETYRDWAAQAVRFKYCIGTSDWVLQTFRNSGIPEEKILGFVYPAVNYDIYKPLDKEKAKEALLKDFPELSDVQNKKRVLIVGKWEPRKNIDKMLQFCFQALDDSYVIILKVNLFGNVTLEHLYSAIKQIKTKLEFSWKSLPAIKLICEDFSDQNMANLYNYCDYTILLSHAEGFGLPIAESQCCGTPVISSDATAMKEINLNPKAKVKCYETPIFLGGYAFFNSSMNWFDPLPLEAIRIISNPEFDLEGESLSEAAKKIFSPEVQAQKLVNLIKSIT